jgi:hypothetical protein
MTGTGPAVKPDRTTSSRPTSPHPRRSVSSRFQFSCSPATRFSSATIRPRSPSSARGLYTDQKTGKPVAATTRYTYQDDDDRYVVSFTRTHDLSLNPMIDTLKGIKRIAAMLMRFDGAYLRFVGDLQISRYRASDLVETFKDSAIWELMYFGRAR